MKLSIIIRNRNNTLLLEQTLKQIKKQEVSFAYEIIVVDNDSTDNSISVAQHYQCKVVHLAKDQFTFGKAINLGIENSSGELIMVISSHVLLLQSDFLEKVPFYFIDPKIAGLRFVNTSSTHQLTESISTGIQRISSAIENSLVKKYWHYLLINHCSVIRRSCWEIESFNELLSSGEDKLWGLNMLKNGYHLLYNVPCYYAYVAKFSIERKINKKIEEEVSKTVIVGNNYSEYEQAFFVFTAHKINNGIRTFVKGLVTDFRIYLGYKRLKRKFSGVVV